METKLLELASSQSIWAALSVILIFYILKAQEKRDLKQEKREENYQQIISNLTDHAKAINEIHDSVEEIKNSMKSKKTE